MTYLKNKNILILIVIGLIFLTSPEIFAQLEDLPGDGIVLDNEPEAPIDGFISIALAVGAYFGVKKLRKS